MFGDGEKTAIGRVRHVIAESAKSVVAQAQLREGWKLAWCFVPFGLIRSGRLARPRRHRSAWRPSLSRDRRSRKGQEQHAQDKEDQRLHGRALKTRNRGPVAQRRPDRYS